MSTQLPKNQSAVAAADLSTKQYFFVKITGAAASGTGTPAVNLTTAITDKAMGVLQDKPSIVGQECAVATEGTSKVTAGAAIAVGAKVAPMASGKAQTAVSTQTPRGEAMEAALADGDVICIRLLDGGVPLP